jgi:hypothetical protein
MNLKKAGKKKWISAPLQERTFRVISEIGSARDAPGSFISIIFEV